MYEMSYKCRDIILRVCKYPDLELFNKLKKQTSNSNKELKIRTQIFETVALVKKLFNHDVFARKFGKVNLWNLRPKALENLHWFARFEYHYLSCAQEEHQKQVRNKLSIMEGKNVPS